MHKIMYATKNKLISFIFIIILFFIIKNYIFFYIFFILIKKYLFFSIKYIYYYNLKILNLYNDKFNDRKSFLLTY